MFVSIDSTNKESFKRLNIKKLSTSKIENKIQDLNELSSITKMNIYSPSNKINMKLFEKKTTCTPTNSNKNRSQKQSKIKFALRKKKQDGTILKAINKQQTQKSFDSIMHIRKIVYRRNRQYSEGIQYPTYFKDKHKLYPLIKKQSDYLCSLQAPPEDKRYWMDQGSINSARRVTGSKQIIHQKMQSEQQKGMSRQANLSPWFVIQQENLY